PASATGEAGRGTSIQRDRRRRSRRIAVPLPTSPAPADARGGGAAHLETYARIAGIRQDPNIRTLSPPLRSRLAALAFLAANRSAPLPFGGLGLFWRPTAPLRSRLAALAFWRPNHRGGPVRLAALAF